MSKKYLNNPLSIICFIFCLSVLTFSTCLSDNSLTLINQPMLLISTLDGTLYALEKNTGKIKWKINDEPLVKLPEMNLDKSNSTFSFSNPLLLPDPKDGSLYLYNGFFTDKFKNDFDENLNENQDILEKMPFTLNEIISSSPCRSSTGYLYTGKKSDSWLIVDALSGKKIETLNADSPFCPREKSYNLKDQVEVPKENLLMIGKTKFHLNIFNLNSRKKNWNLTVIDYTSTAAISISQSNYDLLHLTSASSGKIFTFDLETNELLWKNQFNSPIISMYEFNLNLASKVIKIPFTTVGTNARKKTAEHKNFIEDENDDLMNIEKFSKTMYPSVYIGKSNDLQTLYTVSSFVDKEKQLLSTKLRRMILPLIEGPKKKNLTEESSSENSYAKDYLNLLVYGFYEFPDFTNIKILPQLVLNQLTRDNLINTDTSSEPKLIDANNKSSNFILIDHDLIVNIDFLINLFISLFVSLMVLLLTTYYIYKKYSIKKKNTKKDTNTSIDLKDGWKKIGKISFNQNHVIGRGSSGTFIYKGLFEGRQEVAVKRVISELFIVTDREIELLSKLQHPNLVRYYITEFDELFRYIAIELAEISLADYIEQLSQKEKILINNKENSNEDLKEIQNNDPNEGELKEILHETCLGIAHLHSLNIVHRDIKPQNILLTKPLTTTNQRKVLITDFGLSKVITETNSFSVDQISTNNVISGTEGWIAPEVIKNKMKKHQNKKLNDESSIDQENLKSKSIDIFSLGCVFYYVMTKGKHPFGNSISRQTNILKNKSDLNEIQDETKLIQYNLIEKMLEHKPTERPSIEAVLKHPFFWNESRKLQFFLCVSDRIEKEAPDSDIINLLEKNNRDVVKGDWKRHISVELQTDLKKFRSYRGTIVKDLLRAMRNKRHHYRELDESLQVNLGSIPDEFCKYFTSRFPRLLIHSYIAMQKYKSEDIFNEFYFQKSDWDFEFNELPRTEIRWFENFAKKNFSYKSCPHDFSPKKTKDNDVVLAPNGFYKSYLSPTNK